LIAAISLLTVANSTQAARRPRYGGTLRVEMRASVRNLDLMDFATDPPELAAKEKLLAQVFETLVRLDETGTPQPLLATSWTHDVEHKRWVFALRTNVEFHNGAPWLPPGGSIAVPDEKPIEQILRDMARMKNAIVLHTPDGSLAGTGPFRIAQFDSGRFLKLVANERYWAGRAYLDSIEIQMGRDLRDQALDFDLNKTDAIELAPTDARRAHQRGLSVAVSSPVDILSLVFDPAHGVSDAVRESLALSLDRAAIQSVLLQKTGESSAALLPNWLSGYAFAFPADRNLARARELAAGSNPISFSYTGSDPVQRAVAERIVLNAREAGLTLRPAAGTANVRLAFLRIAQPDPQLALEDLSATLGSPLAGNDPFERERSLLNGFRIIPIAHLPAAWQFRPTVHGWLNAPAVALDRWPLADVWLDEVH
jgi:peptide/nickel transport system substrate-binding protein